MRQGEQLIFEFAAAGKHFATWFIDESNKQILADAINAAVKSYQEKRTQLVYSLGVPQFQPAASDAASATASASPPAITDQVVARLGEAAAVALNYAQFFAAKAVDFGLTDSSAGFCARFSIVNRENAQIAFLSIADFVNGWAAENHLVGGMAGRASLNTLIFAAVFEKFVELDLNKRTFTPPDKEVKKDGVEGDVIEVEAPEESTPLSTFRDLYRSKEIDPLRVPTQARQIFSIFAGTDIVQRLVQLRWAPPSAVAAAP